MKKPALLIFIFFLFIVPSTVLAVDNSLELVGTPSFSYSATQGTAEVTFTVKNKITGSTQGIIELYFDKNNLQQTFLTSIPPTCDSSTPYNKHIFYYTTVYGDLQTITISATGIPPGTYMPRLVSYDKCCAGNPSPPCTPVTPFADNYPLKASPITFTSSNTCVVSSEICDSKDNDCDGAVDEGCNPSNQDSSVDFEIVDIRRISGWAENYINAGLLLGESKDNEIMKVTIKNTGTITSGTQLEAYFVSVTNPFYNIIKSSPRNCNILQSFYFQGILTESPSCKGDSAVRSYSIGKISPGTQIDVFIAVPENELDPPTSLAGYSNHNPDGKYLLVATAYNGCNGGSTIYYDQVARSVGEFNSPCGDLLTSTLIPGTNTTTTFDSPEAKTTLTAEQLKTATDVQLIASQCSLNSECESENCESLKSLIDSGQISEAKADEFMTRTNAVITGSTIGGVTAGVGCTAAIVLSSVVFTPIVGGVTALVCTAGGAALGGLIGYWTDKTVDALAERDTATFGYCMEDDASSFGSFISSIGHSINNQFGGPTKTKLDDATLGYTFFGLILIIIMFLVFKK